MEFKQKNTKFLFLVFISIFIGIFILYSFSPFKEISYNMMHKFPINNKVASDKIALVVIDDKSLKEVGRWPWKREYYIEIFDYFESYTKAKLVGYDAIVMAPDLEHPQSDKKFFSKVKDFKKLTAGFSFSFSEFEKQEDREYYEKYIKTKNDIKVIDKRTKDKQASPYKSFSVLQKEYFENINSLGAVVAYEDTRGSVNKIAQLTNYKGQFLPALAFSMYSKYSGIKEFELTDKYLQGKFHNNFLKIPIESDKGLIKNYIYFYKSSDGMYSHQRFSASDIINSYRAIKAGKKPIVEPEFFNDKVVSIGAYAQAQALEDVKKTPISEKFSGLDIQATNFDNLINNDFFNATSLRYDFLICVFIFLLVFLFVNSMPIINALLSSVCLMLGYFIFALLMYSCSVAVDVILPELLVLVAIGCAYSYRYLIEDNKKTKIQKAMGKYLSYDVMQNVVENIDNISLGGKRANITVLFADIRNFTSISESMSADSVTAILNEYFSALVPVIEEHNGVLNKFMGDAILAIFGEPKKSDNHALDAVRSAYKMLKKVEKLQNKWLDEGKPKIEIGIGIATGEAFIGNIGSQERFEYTVIGDTVNTASRIENCNKEYKTNFLISESTYNLVKKYVDVITRNNVTIRGKVQKINIYEVVRLVEIDEL